MAMAVDNRQQSHMSAMDYENMRYPQPQFNNPWVSAAAPSSHLYHTSIPQHSAAANSSNPQRPTAISLPYSVLPVPAPSIGSGIPLSDGLYDSSSSLGTTPDHLLNSQRAYGGQYSAAASSSTFAPSSIPASYPMNYGSTSAAPYGFQDPARRSPNPSVPSISILDTVDPDSSGPPRTSVDLTRLNAQGQRNSFSEALDASQGMLAMSQSDITPRNIYGGNGHRNSTDSYGFPSTHSTHSSISSASYNPSYYNGSVTESSVTDYSSASESVDMNPRTLPRPSAMIGTNVPPAPQSMMGQFSSKVSSSSQKKHKCKVCDKRFTRPSSLQTHMYSHTGEKPFACDFEGCGRHFSVVSNLRRHRKVHKGQDDQDHPSPDE
ncbi:hypothetical protein P152DRAFT_473617 [Eremomyces bilateralis CBS 781.70]|uniref:C2H2-type domain-containing protein n=1 Tax=Eremomyces bilateralis CBS 781.70 TaxID=1392243 RepID=A0A6G1G310_9PEZI|nr:uncharacterized protein P152DRAFT_473617 [Eremomyces bilateralis CBS 781.70]KAF1812444.1 hypothetical protein P152DRAFT_473617 [Eremomyces bilateralis CBS 781.70]